MKRLFCLFTFVFFSLINSSVFANLDNEFKDFLNVVINSDAAFHVHYEKASIASGEILNTLKENKPFDSELQVEASQIIMKTHKVLDDYREAVIVFQNSSNPNLRKVVQECLKLIEHGKVVLKQLYSLVLTPKEFLSSDERIKKLTEDRAQLNEQYEYTGQLLEKVYKEESTKAEQVPKKIEFQYSQDELKAMEKWKYKTMNEMMCDALNGDAVALYMIGMGYLYGKCGFPINVEQANQYFSTSALLGFAPAIDKIKGMYLDEIDNPNLFLFLVYVNLTASFGHSEFTMVYYDQRKRIAEQFGNSMVKEIERVANDKTIKIYKAMNQIEESEDKMKTTFNFLIENGITGEDKKFGIDYWEKFSNKN